MTEQLKHIQQNENSRDSIIEYKNSLRAGEFKADSEDVGYLISLLGVPDAKSRKHVALTLGYIGDESAVTPLYEALEKEETEYVKSAYLTALKGINIDKIRTKLAELRNSLVSSNADAAEENKKHYDEQMEAYNQLLGSPAVKHTFSGSEIPSEVILTTPKGLGQLTADGIFIRTKKVLSLGVCAKIDSLNDVKKIRTYKEILYIVPDMKKLSADPYKAAEEAAESSFRNFLCERHKEDAPWGYRINIISRMDDKKKSNYIKRFSGELERRSGGYFINQSSDYELELRLLENKERSFTALLKLFTVKDDRFSYRKEHVASSIRPELAANLMVLAADYLKSSVQVLDPFCGVGTMLIERYKYRKASPMFGVDTFGEAVEKAKKNASAADLEAYFINRDYFTFKHDYPFDEIITNMPFSLKAEDGDRIDEIYRKFFDYSRKLLKHGAAVIIYARNIESARNYSRKYGYLLQKEVLISEKENSYLCIYWKK